MEPMILSVTFAAGDPADGGAVAILIKWSDKREERLKQTDNLEVYTASAKHRASLAGGSLPTTNSAPWADWFVKYADAYDDANGGPPSGHPAASSGFDGMDDDIPW